MNAWFLLRRMRGPAFLILVGITALLDQWGVLSFSRSWPLYLILAGVFGLAERALIAAAPAAEPPNYPGYPGYPAPYAPGPPAVSPSNPVSVPASGPPSGPLSDLSNPGLSKPGGRS